MKHDYTLIELDALLQKAMQRQQTAKQDVEKIKEAILDRVAAAENDARQYHGKTDGAVKFHQEGLTVTVTRPKRVEWDQQKLADLIPIIAEVWEELPEDYIDTKYSVREGKYKHLPKTLQKYFESARTVKTGAPSCRLTPVGAGQ